MLKIKKADVLSVFHRVLRFGENKPLFVISVIAGFRFAEPHVLLDESELWDIAGQAVSEKDVFDAWLPKPQGEFLVAGKAYACGAESVQATEVMAAVGDSEKKLYVFGDRIWKDYPGVGSLIKGPKPFSSMDLTFDKAFGGEFFPDNPRGKGFYPKDAERSIVRDLPNLEYPGQLMTKPDDTPSPAAFSPIGMEFASRLKLAGTYDERWKENNWPWFPKDFKLQYFNAAPADQRIDGYFKGGEKIVVEGMHPQKARITSSVPDFRLRLFVHRLMDGQENFSELNANIDTVWLFPTMEAGALILRSSIITADEKATDIIGILANVESSNGPCLTIREHRDVYLYQPGEEAEEVVSVPEPEIREEPQVEAPSMPDAKAMADFAFEREQELARLNELKAQGAELESQIARMLTAAGLSTALLFPQESFSVEEPPEEEIKEPEMNEESLASLKAQAKELEEKINKMLDEAGIDPKKAFPTPDVENFKPAQPFDEAKFFAGLLASGALPKTEAKALTEMLEENRAGMAKIDELIQQAQKEEAETEDIVQTEDDAESIEEEYAVRAWTREELLRAYSTGESLAGADLTGLDLRDMELSGADLRGAIFDEADLTWAVLTGCDLTDAKFTGTVLYKTKLNETRLSGSSFCDAKAEDADFMDSYLAESDFTGADLKNAIFLRSNLESANFTDCRLEKARLGLAIANHANFTRANLNEAFFKMTVLIYADFTGASLDKSDFSEANAENASFYEVNGKNAIFYQTNLKNARADETTSITTSDFRHANLFDSVWSGADMSGSNFHHAEMGRADFSRCELRRTDMYRAKAVKARFSQADLAGARLVSINLFQGDLMGAQLAETDLTGANLYEVEFLNAHISESRFLDANLNGTKLENWRQS